MARPRRGNGACAPAAMDDGACAGMPQAEPAVLRKGPWTAEEDQVLVSYVAAHGEGSWNSLARAAGLSRTGKSCRLRWLNYLRPDVQRGHMTADEQELIVSLQARWGNKWSRIAKHLPGRTDNEVKNFWRTRVQPKTKKPKSKDRDGGSTTDVIHTFAAAGMCGSTASTTPAIVTETAEGQGSSSGSVWTGVTQDYGIVAHQQPSICSVDDDLLDHRLGHHHHQIHGGGAGGGSSSTTGAAAMDFLPELLAASGESFWAIDDFWSATMVPPYHGSNSS